MLTGMDREVTYTARQPLSLQVVQCALRHKGGDTSQEVSPGVTPRQVRTCTKSETSLKGLSNFTKLAATPAQGEATGRASPALPPCPPSPLPNPRVSSENKDVSLCQTLHPLSS